MASGVTYEGIAHQDLGDVGVSDAPGSEHLLFSGLKLWFSHMVPQRKWFMENARMNGAEVMKLENSADIRLVDHTRKNQAPGTYSYRFIELSIRNSRLEDLNVHKVGSTSRVDRPVGGVVTGPKGTRRPFTEEDDQFLWDFITPFKNNGGQYKGNEIYKQVEMLRPSHTYQSWRDRYIKHVIYHNRTTSATVAANIAAVPDVTDESNMAESSQPPAKTAPRLRRQKAPEPQQSPHKRPRLMTTKSIIEAQSSAVARRRDETDSNTQEAAAEWVDGPAPATPKTPERSHRRSSSELWTPDSQRQSPLTPTKDRRLVQIPEVLPGNFERKHFKKFFRITQTILEIEGKEIGEAFKDVAADNEEMGHTGKEWRAFWQFHVLPIWLKRNNMTQHNINDALKLPEYERQCLSMPNAVSNQETNNTGSHDSQGLNGAASVRRKAGTVANDGRGREGATNGQISEVAAGGEDSAEDLGSPPVSPAPAALEQPQQDAADGEFEEVTCTHCYTSESRAWRHDKQGNLLCRDCWSIFKESRMRSLSGNIPNVESNTGPRRRSTAKISIVDGPGESSGESAENMALLNAVHKFTSDGLIGQPLWDAVEEQLREQGFDRGRGAARERWRKDLCGTQKTDQPLGDTADRLRTVAPKKAGSNSNVRMPKAPRQTMNRDSVRSAQPTRQSPEIEVVISPAKHPGRHNYSDAAVQTSPLRPASPVEPSRKRLHFDDDEAVGSDPPVPNESRKRSAGRSPQSTSQETNKIVGGEAEPGVIRIDMEPSAITEHLYLEVQDTPQDEDDLPGDTQLEIPTTPDNMAEARDTDLSQHSARPPLREISVPNSPLFMPRGDDGPELPLPPGMSDQVPSSPMDVRLVDERHVALRGGSPQSDKENETPTSEAEFDFDTAPEATQDWDTAPEQIPVRRNARLATQALFEADEPPAADLFALPAPDGGWDQFDVASDEIEESDLAAINDDNVDEGVAGPSSAAVPTRGTAETIQISSSSPSDQAKADSVPQDIDAWVAQQKRVHSSIKGIDQMLSTAIQATCFDFDIATTIVVRMVNFSKTEPGRKLRREGKIPPPNDVPGCWTDNDDNLLFSQDSRDWPELFEKHGEANCNARFDFLELMAEAG